MTSSLLKGTVTLSDGTSHDWIAGPRERIKAERTLGVKLTDLKDGLGEEYIAFLVWASLQRQNVPQAAGSFDDFLEQLDDYEVDTNPESPAPPTQ